MATPLAAMGIDRLPEGGRNRLVVLGGLLLILTLAGREFIDFYEGEIDRDNRYQVALLDEVLRLTASDEPVFDTNGGYLFRPAAYRYWYHPGAMRRMFFGEMAREIVPSVIDTGAPVWIRDMRFDQLPPNVRSFFEEHYEPILGPIHLWSRRIPIGEPDRYFAIRDRFYFAAGGGAGDVMGSRVLVDGAVRQWNKPFELEKGWHEVEVECPSCGGTGTGVPLLAPGLSGDLVPLGRTEPTVLSVFLLTLLERRRGRSGSWQWND